MLLAQLEIVTFKSHSGVSDCSTVTEVDRERDIVDHPIHTHTCRLTEDRPPPGNMKTTHILARLSPPLSSSTKIIIIGE